MKRRTARKIFNRVSGNLQASKRYKSTTMARAFTKVTGMECKPKDALLVCGLAHLAANGTLDTYIQQSDMELAS